MVSHTESRSFDWIHSLDLLSKAVLKLLDCRDAGLGGPGPWRHCVPRKTSSSWTVWMNVSLYVLPTRGTHGSMAARPCWCPGKHSLAFELAANGVRSVCGLGDRNTVEVAQSSCHGLPSARADLEQTVTLGWWEFARDKPQLWEMLGQGITLICVQLGSSAQSVPFWEAKEVCNQLYLQLP